MSMKFDKTEVPGAFLHKPFEAATIPELKRWLKCRGASIKGLKSELVERCKIYSADPTRFHNVIDPDLIHPPTPEAIIVDHPSAKDNLQDGVFWTKSLLGLSSGFGEGKIFEHLGGPGEKHRVAGYNMFKCGKVINMLISTNKTSNLEVKGIVGASYGKDRYRCSVEINNITGRVDEGRCSCKTGAKGICKHVAAMLFKINDYKQSGSIEIEEELACTEKPREWGVKKSRAPMVSKTFEELTFVKFDPDKTVKNIERSEKRRQYSSLPVERKAKLSPDRLKNLASNMKSTRSMWSDLIVEHYSSECESVQDQKCIPNYMNDLDAALINGLSHDVDLECNMVIEKIKTAIEAMPPLTGTEINEIEEQTRGQSVNNKWFYHRKDRITASIAGDIVHRRPTTPPDALVSKICQYVPSSNITPVSCQHGLQYEAEARQQYIDICKSNGQDVTVEQVGLIVDKKYQWLGASVDGIVNVKNNGSDKGILEIKCPYVDSSKGKENVPQDLIQLSLSRKNFYLNVDTNSLQLSINTKHNYYFQVQTQLGVLGITWCDFMIYYRVCNTNVSDIFITRVVFDQHLYTNTIVPKLYDFYLRGVVPEIITRRIKKGHRLYPSSKTYIYK